MWRRSGCSKVCLFHDHYDRYVRGLLHADRHLHGDEPWHDAQQRPYSERRRNAHSIAGSFSIDNNNSADPTLTDPSSPNYDGSLAVAPFLYRWI